MLNLKKITASLFALIVLVYIAACGYLYSQQDKILFPGNQTPSDFQYSFDIPFEEVWIEVDGAKLHGLYYPAEGEARTGSTGNCEAQEAEMTEDGEASAAGDVSEHRRYRTTKPGEGQNASTPASSCGSGSKGIILFFHGNSERAEQFGESADVFTSRGYDYFIPDYRGYGKSTGEVTSEAQFLADTDRIYEWARAKYPENKIVFAGRSMGAVPAAYLASKHQPKVTVMIAAFYNVAAMKDIRYPFLPDFLLNYDFPNNKWIAESKSPIYLVHGTEDDTVPHEHSLRLSPLAKAPHKHFSVPGAGHNNLQEFPIYHQILYHILALDEPA